MEICYDDLKVKYYIKKSIGVDSVERENER